MTARIRPGEIVPLRGDAATVIAPALAVHDQGGIPLIGDVRRPREQWARVEELAARAGARPGLGWAALTSGTTGTPRIVLRTADSWASSFAAIDALLGRRPDDVLFLPAPPASSMTLFSIAHAHAKALGVVLGGGGAVTPGPARDATLFHGTPGALLSMIEAIESGSPSRLRSALVGGSDLAASTRERAERLGIRVVAYYGAAELSFVAVDQGDGLRPFPGVEVQVRDDVLWVRSPYVAAGYLTDGPQTDGSETDGPVTDGPFRTDDDGWCTVGDRAALDGDRITLRGRRDDAILTASATVIPGEVEAAIRSLPWVGDAVVFGMPNATIGSLVAAVVEPAAGRAVPALSTVRAQADAVLSHTHRPRRWFGMSELPRTASGKPARAAIVARVLAGEVTPLGELDR
ncbi:class I adenylate-forming enzyme family protein [Leifsonia poae]|uniref:O-succinylbenzoate--CoA ligase n=1 Tax=Leifsonia poae TaxID=110933 RepID=A0A9W6H7W2_9MICO|nr:class I adenylate-forming enzyme family protein [Leifsonia poae]GLJ75235.1 hypothetical protein GCM10017584_08090 [Leifsonia poae]